MSVNSSELKSHLYGNDLLSKLKKYYFRFGFRGGTARVFKRILTRIPDNILYLHEIVLVEKHLPDKKIVILPRIDIRIGLLEPEDIEKVQRLSLHTEGETVDERLAKGHHCFVARYKNDICFAAWVAVGGQNLTYKSKEIYIKDNEVYIYDVHTVAAYRGNNIAPAVNNYISNYLEAKGYRRLVVIIHEENFSSIRSFQKAGFEIFDRTRFLKTFFMKRERVFRKSI